VSDTQLLLDGPELDPLIERARELGGRVVKAERVRRMFGKARFEVTVEVPGLSDGAVPVGGTGAAGAAGPGSELASGARSTRGATGRTVQAGGATAPAGLAALLAAADGADGVGTPTWTPLGAPTLESATRESATLESGARDGGPAVAGRPRSAAGRPGSAAGRPGTAVVPAFGDGGLMTSQDVTAPGALTRAEMAAPALLRDLGVPAPLVPPAVADPLAGLLALAARLPRPVAPALRPGNVVAVVGQPDEVLETCAQMLVRLREHPYQLVLVGEEAAMPGAGFRLTSPRRAARLRSENADKVVVVAVGAGTSKSERRVAEGVLGGLAPDQVWAALDARLSPGELAQQLQDLPVGRVDAVAGQRAWEAARPGTLLDLGLPVGWLDGLAATPTVWAAVLDEARTKPAFPALR
jgi:hypothetical protein